MKFKYVERKSTRKPPTKEEAEGITTPTPKDIGTSIFCYLCQQPGGTLLSDGHGKYAHKGCKSGSAQSPNEKPLQTS
jgi:hypothetical protein